MSPELLSLILWIPFAITVIIAGLVHCISGYKRGLWRALISLGAVVVSTVISIFVSRILAKVLTPVILGLIPMDSLGEGIPTGMINMLAGGIVSMVLSIVLFGIIMFIVSIILHVVSVKVKKDKLLATDKKMKFFGMGVGVISAVLFACVWLSPVYGSLATVVPIAETVISMQESDEASNSFIAQCIESVKSHPIVAVSESGPVAMVYSSISYFSMNDTSVSIVDVTSSISEVTELFEEIKNIDDPSDIEPLAGKLIGVLKKSLVEQGWVYSFAQEMINEVKNYEEVEELLEDPIIKEVFAIFEVPEEDFNKNIIAILDFGQYALENGIIKLVEDFDMEGLYSSGIIQEAGKLANVSAESVKVKKFLIAGMVSQAFDGDLAKAKSFVDKYDLGKLEDADKQLAEAEAIFISLEGSVAEALIRHPSFGEAAVRELFEKGNIAELIGYGYYEEAVEEFLANNKDGKEQIISELKKSAEGRIDNDSFGKAMDELLDIENYVPEFDYVVGGESFGDSAGEFEVKFDGENGGKDYVIYGPDGEKITGTIIGGSDGIYEIVGGDGEVKYDGGILVEGGKVTVTVK